MTKDTASGGTSRRVAAVTVVSLLVAGLAELARLPAGALLGSMLVSIAAALTLATHAPVSRRGMLVAQSVLGGALCSSFSPEAWSALADNWAVSLAAVVGVVAVAQGVALVCARLGHLDPRTATLGLMPGGSSAMIALSDELGADARLVTLFQCMRLCVVILVAVAVGRWAGDTPAVALAQAADLPGSPPPLVAWLTTAAVSVVGSVLGLRLRLPAGSFLGPVLLGIPITAVGIPVGAWPPGVLALALWALGVRVGSEFDASSAQELKRVAHLAVGASSSWRSRWDGCSSSSSSRPPSSAAGRPHGGTRAARRAGRRPAGWSQHREQAWRWVSGLGRGRTSGGAGRTRLECGPR